MLQIVRRVVRENRIEQFVVLFDRRARYTEFFGGMVADTRLRAARWRNRPSRGMVPHFDAAAFLLAANPHKLVGFFCVCHRGVVVVRVL